MHIFPNYATCKLLCEYRGKQVKVEVNKTKRGIVGGELMHLPLCEKAQDEFQVYCIADIVPISLLYGGKVAAALCCTFTSTSTRPIRCKVHDNSAEGLP